MRRAGLVVGIIGIAVSVGLAGCAPSSGRFDLGTGTEPGVEYAARGTSAIPLGCADLLAVADVAGMSPAGEPPMADVIDEARIAQDMSVSELQAGALRCVWSNNYGGTDFSRSVHVTVAPSTATALDPATEPPNIYGGGWVEAAAEHPTLESCLDDSWAGNCTIVQLRAGYRIDLDILASDTPSLGPAAAFSHGIVEAIGSRVDAAGPARAIAPAPDTDIAARCAAPEVTMVVAARGGSGPPSVAANSDYATVIDCTWMVANPDGSPYPEDYTLTVSVLPGGAWAVDRIASGVGAYGNNYRPASDGGYLVSEGFFGLGAFRALGDDLIQVTAPYRDGDPDAWVQQLAAAW